MGMKKTAIAAALVCVLGAGQAAASSYDDLNAGIQLRNQGLWSDAIAEFDKALAAGDLPQGQHFIALLGRGYAHHTLREFGPAIADYSSALEVEPGSMVALSLRAYAYQDTDKLPESASDLDAMIAAHPRLASPYDRRAILNAMLGFTEKSQADFKKILELASSDHSERSFSLGVIAWQAGQLDLAADNFSYVAGSTGNIYGWLWLSLVNIRTGKNVTRTGMPDFDKANWPAPLVGLYTGDTKQDAVFAAVGDGKDVASRNRTCLANFYVGEWLLLHHDAAGAKPLIEKAANSCVISSLEGGQARIDRAVLTP
jgi:tetratricopeptide (TPR) repeat protein